MPSGCRTPASHAPTFLAAPSQTTQPGPTHFAVEAVERWIIVRPAIVAIVPAQNGGEPLVLRGQWRVHEPPGVLAQCRQLARQAFPFRLVLHDEPAISGPPAVVGEAEEGEGLWPLLAAPLTREGREFPQYVPNKGMAWLETLATATRIRSRFPTIPLVGSNSIQPEPGT